MKEHALVNHEKRMLNNPDSDKKNINLIKALLLLIAGSAVFVILATWLGYKFFWYQPVYKSSDDYELRKAISNVEKNPNNAALRVELGWGYMAQGNLESAKAEFQNALKIDKEDSGAKINLAMVLAEQGDLVKAKRLLNEVISKKPGSLDAQLMMGQLYIQTKEYGKAIKSLNLLNDLNPGTVDLLYLLGKAYEGKGEKTKAIDYYEKALSYMPDFEKARLALNHLKNNGDLSHGN